MDLSELDIDEFGVAVGECGYCGNPITSDDLYDPFDFDATEELRSENDRLRRRVQELEVALLRTSPSRVRENITNVSEGVKSMASLVFDVVVIEVVTNAVGVTEEEIKVTENGILAPDAQTAAFIAGLKTDASKAKLTKGGKLVIRTRALSYHLGPS